MSLNSKDIVKTDIVDPQTGLLVDNDSNLSLVDENNNSPNNNNNNEKKELSKTGRFFNVLKSFFSKPSNIILVIFSVILTVFVIIPLVFLLYNTFIVHPGEGSLGKINSLTINHWFSVLFERNYDYAWNSFWKPLLLSVGMSCVACFISVFVGGSIAYLITRTDLPCKKFISVVFIFPYIMPSWSIAMFWENLFRNTGLEGTLGQKGLLEAITTLRFSEAFVYGFWPCAICLGIHYAPFAYILIGGILRNMDANLEEAATILKANRAKILWKITLPIVLPALMSTVLLVFASSISSYTVPAFLNRNGFVTISLRMRSLFNNPQNKGQGYVVATILMAFSIGILMLNQKVTNSRKSFTTVTGKSSQISLVKMKLPVKIILTSLVMFYTLFFAVLPLVTFALESFLVEPGDYSRFTVYYWITSDQTSVYIPNSTGIFRSKEIWMSFLNSLIVSVFSAFFAGTFGILIGYGVAKRRRNNLSNYVSNTAFLPYLIPAMSFSAVYLSVSLTPAFSFLRNTIPLLIIVGSIKFTPFASKTGTNAMLQLSNEIEEAAIIVGVPWWKRMLKILFPIQKSSFISGYLLPFISCMRELSLFVLISSSGTILTSVLQTYETNDCTQISNGINLIIIGTVLIINLLVNKLTGASIDKGVGG